MTSNHIGIRMFTFCATFLLGFLLVESLVSEGNKLTSIDIEKRVVLKQEGEPERTQIVQRTVEPPCRQHFNFSRYNQLSREQVEIRKVLMHKILSSQDQKSTRQKLKDVQREIKSLREYRNGLEKREREQSGIQNLLYIENCAEYKRPY